MDSDGGELGDIRTPFTLCPGLQGCWLQLSVELEAYFVNGAASCPDLVSFRRSPAPARAVPVAAVVHLPLCCSRD